MYQHRAAKHWKASKAIGHGHQKHRRQENRHTRLAPSNMCVRQWDKEQLNRILNLCGRSIYRACRILPTASSDAEDAQKKSEHEGKSDRCHRWGMGTQQDPDLTLRNRNCQQAQENSSVSNKVPRELWRRRVWQIQSNSEQKVELYTREWQLDDLCV